MNFDPNAISDSFASACAGYSRAPASALSDLLARLPAPRSKREIAIADAVRDGIARPARWEQIRQPLILTRRPGVELPVWREKGAEE